MKFIIQKDQKKGKSTRQAPNASTKKNDPNYYFYNIMNPSNKVQCDICKKDIGKQTKILANQSDYCVACFANLNKNQNPIEEYHVVNKLDFPMFDAQWTAQQQLMLFEGLQKHGFGNWNQISEFIGTGKSRQEVQEHYSKYFLQSDQFLPTKELLSKRDNKGKLVKKVGQMTPKRAAKETKRNVDQSSHQHQRGTLTVNNQTSSSLKANANAAQIVGYMPKRGDFQVQYDNDAQLLLAEMEFNDDDDQDEKNMKFKLMEIYNQKLTQRIRRKQFVIKRGLLDLKEQSRLEKNRTKQEKQIYNMMKVFARFNTVDDHQKLVNGIIRQRQIRQRIQQLKQYRKKGFRTLAEIQQELDNKRRKEEKSKKKVDESSMYFSGVYDSNKQNTRRSRKDIPSEKYQKKNAYLNPQQTELCRKLDIKPQQYMVLKETIIAQSVKLGVLDRDQTLKIFKVDRSMSQGVFDFLVQKQDIVVKKDTHFKQ